MSLTSAENAEGSQQVEPPRVLPQLRRFLVLCVLAGAFARPAAPQTVTDSWAPQGPSPIGLIVNDPVRGVIPFPPVHGTLLPDGRVMLFSTTNVHARAAWFTPTPIEQEPPPFVVLTPDTVPVDVDPPMDLTDPSGLQW